MASTNAQILPLTIYTHTHSDKALDKIYAQTSRKKIFIIGSCAFMPNSKGIACAYI